MSAATVPSPPEDESLLNRLYFTPLSDALRGRWTLTLDPRRVVASANLPPKLERVVWEVIRKTRLRDAEKVDVANELVAHFHDGLAAGTNAEQLLESFGDPKIAARLIRRSKQRRRPLLYRATKRLIQIVAALILLIACIFSVLYIRFNSGTPHISRDYVAEFNADVLRIPENDRAWPLYKNAVQAMVVPPEYQKDDLFQPHERTTRPPDNWSKYANYCTANREAVRLFREAASKVQLGALLSDVCEPSLADLCDYPFGKGNVPKHPAPHPKLTEILHPEQEVLMRGFGLLRVDLHVSLDTGDAARCLADIEAMLGIARHLGAPPHSYNCLNYPSVFMQIIELIGKVLRDKPHLFSKDQWIALSHRLAAIDLSQAVRDYAAYRKLMFEDLIQRIYTDDGAGDGRIVSTKESIGYFMCDPAYCNFPDDIDRSAQSFDKFFLPAISPLIANRTEILAKFDALMALNLQELSTPLWQRDLSKADQVVTSWYDDFRKFKYLPVGIFFSSMSVLLSTSETAALQRDAILVAIALELYRRENGSYPSTLQALAPRYIPAVPLDRFDGNPMRYKLKDGKPLLYSVGSDRLDSGGVIAKGSDAELANSNASFWYPLSMIPEFLKGKSLRPGDWLLWPPIN